MGVVAQLSHKMALVLHAAQGSCNRQKYLWRGQYHVKVLSREDLDWDKLKFKIKDKTLGKQLLSRKTYPKLSLSLFPLRIS